jgi:glutamate racemase
MHLVITDSGLGGLGVCAGIERAWRLAAGTRALRITYVNAWPEEGRGYNDLPDVAARARVFDRALRWLDALGPDRILIACNTLSILYPFTERSRLESGAPVQGIIDAGVDLFARALTDDASAGIVLVGTRTTIDAGVHRDGLLRRGIRPDRVGAASCHGLATAIENALNNPQTEAAIQSCAGCAAASAPAAPRLFLGLCCTHYAMASERLVAAIRQRVGVEVSALDPNARLVEDVVGDLGGDEAAAADSAVPQRMVSVRVVSKVTVPESKRTNVASVLEPVSPATALALREYVHDAGVF